MEAEGVEVVARRRVGASRIRWYFRVGCVEAREERVESREVWVEGIEEFLR